MLEKVGCKFLLEVLAKFYNALSTLKTQRTDLDQGSVHFLEILIHRYTAKAARLGRMGRMEGTPHKGVLEVVEYAERGIPALSHSVGGTGGRTH
ncbi:MAG: hypothetical protein F4246_00310 [Rhodothermaceae bacterium]|nr:hypothetical protein [Rhodothermaceae bacterium]MXX57892.1 hypothetical protein [Rhodothermaceae bacterium]MYD18834.1 hypothetical protein [Rhodothermaceae bacterium]MYD55434.1 hypothetical protein [Rhodothermaceae bacterium]MYI43782.1 hypothetical protein [Rhodothermaceae bacterium]